ncbi:uncharacterized protein LOC143295291 isoform X2 [Babylonia areolata]|uniref:uncharacterized protein LOC143295291 isoform X2 n=1 Tax=Babylonia areolata TaxID=304850 RepID=UPI003FD22C86
MASTQNPDLQLKDKPKQEFNKIRRILLRNIPPSTEGEIEEFLGKFKAEKIEISESLDSAIVTLKNGRQLEEAVTELDNKKLKDNDVTVTFCASDKLICVAHLPPRYSDEDLTKMMEEHGKMKTCFIMRSETTGRSKSYALLEFEEQDVDKVRQVRDEIDWKEVGSHLLHADFIEPSFQTWDRLQSRCLAVSGLPKEFTETNKLREMFSVVTSPVYCQIVMLEKESLGMGIVEFRKPEEAEETWEKVQDSKIEDKEITVTFCIPSKSAVFINNRIMWKFSDKVQKSSLLPDPSAAKPVISNNALVLSLVKQNPNLIEDFTKVLAEFHQAYVNHMMSPGNKPGLLGPAPTLPMSPMMNPHLQMGLMIMLVIHIHTEKKEPFTGILAKQLNSLSESPSASQGADSSGKKPSILGDPMTAQANIVLTNLKKQLNQVPVTDEDKRVVTSSSPAVRAVMAKFLQNARYLNLNLLVNLGQMVMNMHASSHQESPMAQAAAAAASSMARHSGGTSLLNPPGSGKGLLGDVPRPNPNPATMRLMKTLEAVASQKMGGQNRGLLSAIMTNINVNPAIAKLEKKTSLLGEPPQHLKQQKDGPGGMGGPGGRNMGNMGPSMNMGNMGGNMGGMGNNMGGMGGMGGMDMGNMMGGMDSMSGGMGNMGGGMGNMGGGMGNMGGGMGGGMGNMGGGMGNMGGGMGNMGGNMGGGIGGNMGGGMGGNMGGGMGGGMGDMSSMGQQGGNKQNWGSGASQGGMGRAAGGNTNTANKTDSYSTFGNYSGGYGDMSGYGSGYTEEYSQFNQGDYNSGGYGDSSMYGTDQSGYQYSDYSGNYSTGQDSYNFQGSNNYSGNFGDYTGGYSSSNTANTGFNMNQNQSGNVQARWGPFWRGWGWKQLGNSRRQ